VYFIHLKNKPCRGILKKGKRKGQECGKNCKLGYEYCGTHLKFDNVWLLKQETNNKDPVGNESKKDSSKKDSSQIQEEAKQSTKT